MSKLSTSIKNLWCIAIGEFGNKKDATT